MMTIARGAALVVGLVSLMACGGKTTGSPLGEGDRKNDDIWSGGGGGGGGGGDDGFDLGGGGASSGPTCAPGEAPTMLAKEQAPVSIAINGSDVFFGVQPGQPDKAGGVRRVAKAGGAVVKISEANEVWGLAADASHVFWADRSNGGISRAGTDGSDLTKLTGARETAYGVALHGGDVFWAERSGVGRVPKMAADASQAVITQGGSGITHVAADSDYVYSADWSGPVRKMPRGGGDAVTLAEVMYAYTIAIDQTHVYFVANGTVRSVAKAGGPTTILYERKPGSEPSLAPDGIAVDASFVYFADFGGDGVWKLPKAGGSPQRVAQGGLFPRAVAVDATCIYWSTDAGLAPNYGTIMKAPK